MSELERINGLIAATDGNAALAAAVTAYRGPLTDLRDADDEIDAARHLARLVLAAEDVETAAASLTKNARELLAAWMENTGCPAVRTDTHSVSLVERRPAPRVVNSAVVPSDYKIPQPDKIDAALIKAAYAKGISVPGTEMGNGGPPHIQFRVRSK